MSSLTVEEGLARLEQSLQETAGSTGSVSFNVRDPSEQLQRFAELCECPELYPGEGCKLILTLELLTRFRQYIEALLSMVMEKTARGAYLSFEPTTNNLGLFRVNRAVSINQGSCYLGGRAAVKSMEEVMLLRKKALPRDATEQASKKDTGAA